MCASLFLTVVRRGLLRCAFLLILRMIVDGRKPGGGMPALSYFYTPMHEVTPKVVAMAVSTVITMFRILLQISLFMIE